MKTHLKHPFLLLALIGGLGLVLAGRLTAQTFTTLYDFTALSPITSTNSDGANPQSGLILSGNTLYGTAFFGGTADNGTVFTINTDGSGFTNLHNFAAFPKNYPITSTNSDGANPQSGLILSGNTLYGTAFFGGPMGHGTVFKVNTDGSGFATLYSFSAISNHYPQPQTNGDGAFPSAGLILSGDTLYGTASEGGLSGNGTVFKVSTNGTCFTTLYSFTAVDPNAGTNSDGANPQAGLVLSGDTLYGTATGGGSSGNGTVFQINTNGTNFAALYSFAGGGDGASPYASLVLSDDTLYGTTIGTSYFDGSPGDGTVFKVRTDGSDFATLYEFTGGDDGAYPSANLILSGDTLYGTAIGTSYFGGSSGYGTVFQLNTNGTGFATLYSFTNGNDGADPFAGLMLSGNTLYGTAFEGGSANSGTLFSFSLALVNPPQLNIISSGGNIVVAWPTNAAEFTLQASPTLSPVCWSNVCPPPVVVNGQNTVTNPISGAQQFYRLSQ